MHICRLNLSFIGLGYRPSGRSSSNYTLKTFELYRCNKCGKPVYKKEEKYTCTYSSTYNNKVRYAERCGYKPLGELLKTFNK